MMVAGMMVECPKSHSGLAKFPQRPELM